MVIPQQQLPLQPQLLQPQLLQPQLLQPQPQLLQPQPQLLQPPLLHQLQQLQMVSTLQRSPHTSAFPHRTNFLIRRFENSSRYFKYFPHFTFSEKCFAGNTNWNCCSSYHKCDLNQGDCDDDSDCKSGLKCGKDNCSAEFPSAFYDCCYNPKEPGPKYPGKNVLLYVPNKSFSTLHNNI